MNERKNLVAPCGIDCGTCELYLSRYDQKILEYLVSKGIPKASLPCNGCRNVEGRCPVMQRECPTYICAKSKGISFCFGCNEFPCSKLTPGADRANMLPHNLKVFNLCTIKRDGLDSFIGQSARTKLLYFNGRMVIGEGPHID